MKVTRFVFFFAALLYSGGVANAQITVTRDIDYRPAEEVEDRLDYLDVFMPDGAKNVPVLVFFHGGALVQGSKELDDALGQKLAKRGIGFVSPNYRLSPAVKHPQHANDAAAATAWVFDNIETYGGDPDNVFVGGHSAGAYLAALLALDRSYLSEAGGADRPVRGAVLVSPFLFVEEVAPTRIAADSIYLSIWGNDPEDWLAASMTPLIRSGQGDILLIYADGDADWRKSQINRFVKLMRQAGNQNVTAVEVPNREHISLVTSVMEPDDHVGSLVEEFLHRLQK